MMMMVVQGMGASRKRGVAQVRTSPASGDLCLRGVAMMMTLVEATPTLIVVLLLPICITGLRYHQLPVALGQALLGDMAPPLMARASSTTGTA